jgi:small multidrug resistance family-3 protein
MYEFTGAYRVVCFLIGAALLFGYGFTVNSTPIEFGKIAGLYIAILFIVWQIVNYIAFRTVPATPVLVGGLMIIAGGAIVTFGRF